MDLSYLTQRANPAQAAGTGAPAGPGVAGSGNAGAGGPQRAGAPQTVDMPSLVLDVTDATFEQIAPLSAVVPVVFDLRSDSSEQSKTLSPILEQVTREFGGRLLLARVEVETNPGLTSAFQAQSVPSVLALIGGQPVPLFQGAVSEAEVRDFFGRLLELAAQNGVSGLVSAPDAATTSEGGPSLPPAPEFPEEHLPAIEAAERGDFAGAIAEWESVLKKSPADAAAKAGLAQMKLLFRLQGLTVDEIRTAAAADAENLEAQMRVADLDLSGGHIEDAFLRLLDLFEVSAEDARGVIRTRLLELFEVVGVTDPRVTAARGKLASLLY